MEERAVLCLGIQPKPLELAVQTASVGMFIRIPDGGDSLVLRRVLGTLAYGPAQCYRERGVHVVWLKDDLGFVATRAYQKQMNIVFRTVSSFVPFAYEDWTITDTGPLRIPGERQYVVEHALIKGIKRLVPAICQRAMNDVVNAMSRNAPSELRLTDNLKALQEMV